MSLLRNMFGPYKDEIWQQLAQEINANYIEGGFWNQSKVEANIDEWTVTLDTYNVSTGKVHIVYTRLRAPYVNRDGFRFKIYRKGFFSELGKKLGMQDVEVGFPDFDDQFIIQGNDDYKLQRLFQQPTIRQLIELQPEISLEVNDNDGWLSTTFPKDVDQLSFMVVGVIKDIDRLKQLYQLFAEILHRLCQIGSAYDDDPLVELP